MSKSVNRLLRISRIIVSIVITALLTAMLTLPWLTVPAVSNWLAKVQLVPVVASLSVVVFVLWLIITLMFGRIYCSTMCPLGTLQDIASRSIRPYRKGALPRRVYRYTRPQPRLRITFLVIMVAAMMAGVAVVPVVLDPYAVYARICDDLLSPLVAGNAVAVSLMSIIGAALLCFIICYVAALNGRLICNTVCPVGTTLGFVSRYSVYQFDIDTDLCTQCRRCEYVCKAQCIDLTDHVVDGSRCVCCFDCINVCPDDAIRYTTRRKQLSIPMMQRTEQRRATSLQIDIKDETVS